MGNPTRATLDALTAALDAHLEVVRNKQPAERHTLAGVGALTRPRGAVGPLSLR